METAAMGASTAAPSPAKDEGTEVKDLQTSITYYRERLGFQLDFQGPVDGPFWAGVSRDGRKLSFVEEGLWGFAITDADGYVLVFYQLRT